MATDKSLVYNEFSKAEENISAGFEKLTNSAIHYPLYRLKEIYPYYYKKAHNLKEFPIVNNDFYNFRNDVNLNEADLVSFYPYQNYVVSYLYNLSYQLIEKDSTKNNLTINILNSIVDNIKLEEFKKGVSSLMPYETKALGNVDGKSLLHLQCHFGQDTLSWSRLGAQCVGVDISDEGIKLAKKLNKELELWIIRCDSIATIDKVLIKE